MKTVSSAARIILSFVALAAPLAASASCFKGLSNLGEFPCAGDGTCPSGFACQDDAGVCVASSSGTAAPSSAFLQTCDEFFTLYAQGAPCSTCLSSPPDCTAPTIGETCMSSCIGQLTAAETCQCLGECLGGSFTSEYETYLSCASYACETTCSGTATVDAGGPTGHDASSPPPPSACIEPPSGIVSWWTADGTTADEEGLNPGSMSGTVTYTTGMVGEAFEFNGASAVIAGTTGFPVGAEDRTFEFWTMLTSSYGSTYVEDVFAEYGTLGGSGEAFSLYTRGTSALEWSQWGSGFEGGTIPLDTWTHIAATSSSGTVTLYVNGAEVASEAISPYYTTSGTYLYIGGYGSAPDGTTERLTGLIDELTVYDRALATYEIQSIYEAGANGKCRVAVP